MVRRPLSNSLIARIRTWFGLTQAELALYLGISPPLVLPPTALRFPAKQASKLPVLIH